MLVMINSFPMKDNLFDYRSLYFKKIVTWEVGAILINSPIKQPQGKFLYPATPKPQNPKTTIPQNHNTPKPQNPNTTIPQNHKTTIPQYHEPHTPNPKPHTSAKKKGHHFLMTLHCF